MSGLATLLFVILLLLIYFNSKSPESPAPSTSDSIENLRLLDKRGQVPNIIWEDQNHKKSTLSSFRGKVLYLNLWAMWCAPCKQEIPLLAEWATELVTKPIHFILINLDDTNEEVEKAKIFLDSEAPQLQGVFNANEVFLNAFQSEVLPAHILIDKKGQLAAQFSGDISEHQNQLKQILLSLLQEN